ncbi:putative lipid II flippase FtsW [bacterium]|nr:putative lipid II flippase FtsW [bacterium]
MNHTLEQGTFMSNQNETTAPSFSVFDAYGGQTLWFPVVALLSFGLLFVYSASSVYAGQKYGDEFLFAKKQLTYILPGALAAFIGARMPIERIQKWTSWIFLTAILLTTLTLVPGLGKKVLGAARWISVHGIQIQPSEFLKIAGVLHFCQVLSEKKVKLWKLATVFLSFAVLLKQPDFGSSLILIIGLAAVLFFCGVPKRFFFGGAAAVIPVIGVLMVAAPYRMKRLVTFLDPFADPLGSGFQVIQSFVAIASGGLFGKGLGGSQQKLFFLPEAHTDFILSVIGEEMGFVGLLIIVLIYGMLFYSLLQLLLAAQDGFSRMVTAGLLAMIAASTLVNMGVCAGLLPTKGLTLPFISSGGSSLVANLFAMGLLAQIHARAYIRQIGGHTLHVQGD